MSSTEKKQTEKKHEYPNIEVVDPNPKWQVKTCPKCGKQFAGKKEHTLCAPCSGN